MRSPCAATDPLFISREPRAPSILWYDPAPGLPNAAEILFYSLLAINYAPNAENLGKWASAALRGQREREQAGSSWTPPPDWVKPSKTKPPAIFQPITDAFAREWPTDDREQIGKAMQAWRKAGRTRGMRTPRLASRPARSGLFYFQRSGISTSNTAGAMIPASCARRARWEARPHRRARREWMHV